MKTFLGIVSVFTAITCFADDHTLPPRTGRATATKPILLYLHRNPAGDLKETKDATLEYLKKDQCGLDVRELEIPKDGNLAPLLAAMNLPRDTPVLFDAVHGSMTKNGVEASNGYYEEDLQYMFDGDVPAAKVFQSVRSVLSDSSLLNNSCSGAGCFRTETRKIGATSKEFGKSFSKLGKGGKGVELSPLNKALLDLYCDSAQLCQKFGSKPGSPTLDKNGDFVLDGEEINSYLNSLADHKPAAPRYQSHSRFKKDDQELLRRHLHRCLDLGGKAGWNMSKTFRFDAQIQKQGSAVMKEDFSVTIQLTDTAADAAIFETDHKRKITDEVIPFQPTERFSRPLNKPSDWGGYEKKSLMKAFRNFAFNQVGKFLPPERFDWDPKTGILKFKCEPEECTQEYAGQYTVKFSEPKFERTPLVEYSAVCQAPVQGGHQAGDFKDDVQHPYFTKDFTIRCRAPHRRH